MTLSLHIAGPDAAGIDGLGSFDLGIVYDPAVLVLGRYTLGGLLGDLSNFEAFDYSVVQSGRIQLTEVSLLDRATLAALQPDGFELARLEFTMAAQGAGKGSAVSIDKVWVLGDTSGQTFDFDSPVDQVVRVIHGGRCPGSELLRRRLPHAATASGHRRPRSRARTPR